LGGSILANKTFFVCGPKFAGLFPETSEESLSITFLSDFGYLESLGIFELEFRDQSKKLSKIAPNFGRFLSSPILGASFPKILPML